MSFIANKNIDLYRQIAQSPRRYVYSNPAFGRNTHSIADNPKALPVESEAGYGYGGYGFGTAIREDRRTPSPVPIPVNPSTTIVEPSIPEAITPQIVTPIDEVPKAHGSVSVIGGLDYDPNESRRAFEWAQRQHERLLNGPRFASDDARYNGQQAQIKEIEGLLGSYAGAYDKDRAYQMEQSKLDLERKKIESEKYRADQARIATEEAAKASSAMNNYKIEVHRKKTADGIEIEKAFSEVQSGLAALAPGKNPSPELKEKYQTLTGMPLVSKTQEDLSAAMAHLANANVSAKKANAEDYQDLITQMSVSDSTRVNSNQSDILQ